MATHSRYPVLLTVSLTDGLPICTGDKIGALAKAGAFYATWLPKQYVGMSRFKFGEFGELARHLRYIERTSRRLARSMFYAMSRYQGKLERKRSEEHTSELQSLMRISYAVFCLKKKKQENT